MQLTSVESVGRFSVALPMLKILRWCFLPVLASLTIWTAGDVNAQVEQSLNIERLSFKAGALSMLEARNSIYSTDEQRTFNTVGRICEIVRERLQPEYINENGFDIAEVQLVSFENLSSENTLTLTLNSETDRETNLMLPPFAKVGVCTSIVGRAGGDDQRDDLLIVIATENGEVSEYDLAPELFSVTEVASSGSDAPFGFQAISPSTESYTTMRVHFGTGRENDGSDAQPVFNNGQSLSLTLGEVTVTIPNRRDFGDIPRPWKVRILGLDFSGTQDPADHFTVQRVKLLSDEDFAASIAQLSPQSFLVFVHGYNVTFEEAAFRTAQIAHDTNYSGVPLFYSWPSNGATKDYIADHAAVQQTKNNLVEFLTRLQEMSGGKPINIVVHSLGNDAVLEALEVLAVANTSDSQLFGQVIFAAPDVATRVFETNFPNIATLAAGYTLYASNKDKALLASSVLHSNNSRAGYVDDSGPVTMLGLDSIDVSSVDLGFLNIEHNQYAESRELLNDIGLLIENGVTPPSARNTTLKALTSQRTQLTYWLWPN